MNKSIFEKVLKHFEIQEENKNAPTKLFNLQLGITIKTYTWNNLEIYYVDYINHSNNHKYFVTVIQGNIPQELIDSINTRKEKEKLNFLTGLVNNHEKMNAYYMINDLKELVIFLSECESYYHPEKPIDEKEIISDIYKEEIIEIKPNKKTEKYLENDQITYGIHQKAIDNNPTTFGKSFIEALSEFDNAVNPFMNYQESGKSFEEFVKDLNLDRFKITIDATRKHILSKRELIENTSVNKFILKDFELTIEDRETGNKAYTSRNNGKILYAIEYTIPGESKMMVTHSINESEKIAIITDGPNKGDTIKISYDITNDTIEVHSPAYAPKQRVNKKYLKYKSDLYTYLLTGINMAKAITINNMTQRKPGKTRERIKPTTEE